MTVALLAGEGALPFLVLEGIRRRGEKVLLLKIRGVASADLEGDETVSLYPTQIGKALRLCSRRGVTKVLLAGRLQHRGIYALPWLKADWQAIKLWLSLKDRRADSLLRALSDLFAGKGMPVSPLTDYLKPYLSPEGPLTKRSLTEQEKVDVALGLKVARELGRLDVGQTVAIKKGAVVAVEAMEGTDSCIQRAADLAGEGLVIVKLAKPDQDMRFDLPVIGKNTLEKLIKVKAKVLAIQAGQTVILDPGLIEEADSRGIALIAFSEGTSCAEFLDTSEKTKLSTTVCKG